MASFQQDGAVSFTMMPERNLETTSTGVDVTARFNITGDGDDLTVSSADYELVFVGNRGSTGTNIDKAYFRMKAEGTNTVVLDTAGDSYINGGNVGIGTTSPSYKLHSTTSSGSDYAGYFHNSAGSGNGTSLVAKGGANNATPNFQVQDYNGNADFTVIGTGNVGIGTASPARQLTVSNSGAALLLLESTGDDNGQLLFGDSADGTVGKVGYAHSTNHLFFNTNGSEKMRITSGGNVGIGTSSPLTQIHVDVTGTASRRIRLQIDEGSADFGTDANRALILGWWQPET